MAQSSKQTLSSSALGTVSSFIVHFQTEQFFRYGDIRDSVRALVEPKIAKKIVPIWDLNEEGELQGTWREIGAPNLWYTMGMTVFSFDRAMHANTAL